jgi:cytochrome b subunit of formate dehydrogenase
MTHETNSTLVLGILVVISSLALVHLARRYPLMRERVVLSEDVSFTVTQRTMHWVIGVGSAVLFFTGLPVYLAQFLVIPSVATPLNFYYWGFQVFVWRTFHIYLALALVGVVVVHALWDTYRMKALGKIKMSKADLAEQWSRARDFFGFSGQGYHQPTTKYDSFQRAFHWTLLALGAFLLVSGLLMWEALRWNGVPLFVVLDRWNNQFMDSFMRTGHLVAGVLFAGLVVLHTYFALLPQNRSLLRSMTLGAGARSNPAEVAPPDGPLDQARVPKGAPPGEPTERSTQKS